MDTDSFIVCLKKIIFMKRLQKMLKLDWIIQLSEKIMAKFVKRRTKTWYYYNLVKQMMAVKIKNKRQSKICHKKKLKI